MMPINKKQHLAIGNYFEFFLFVEEYRYICKGADFFIWWLFLFRHVLFFSGQFNSNKMKEKLKDLEDFLNKVRVSTISFLFSLLSFYFQYIFFSFLINLSAGRDDDSILTSTKLIFLFCCYILFLFLKYHATNKSNL